MRFLTVLLLLLNVTNSACAQTEKDSPSKSTVAAQSESVHRQADSMVAGGSMGNSLTWLLSIAVTAVVSPVVVKWVEKRLAADPVKDQAGRLKSLIEVASLQKSHGLPEDPRIRGLIEEQTDKLAVHASGRQETLDSTISALIGDLSVRLCESHFQSCQQLELLQDSKHCSNKFNAILDLTRLEFLRSAHGIECLGVPPHFRSISKKDFDDYIIAIAASTTPVGEIAIKHASDLGTTPEAVEHFVKQIRESIKNPSVETQAASVLRGKSSE